MKLIINYDLMDKIKEANTGFSFNRFRNNVLLYTTINTSLDIPFYIADDASLDKYIICVARYLMFHASLQGITEKICSSVLKSYAQEELNDLSIRLKDIFVDTEASLLLEAYMYRTEYDLDFEGTVIPRFVQKKYIMVPVHNEWDNNERSLVQEHIIGTKEYVLSHGEPEKKVLALGQKQYAKK